MKHVNQRKTKRKKLEIASVISSPVDELIQLDDDMIHLNIDQRLISFSRKMYLSQIGGLLVKFRNELSLSQDDIKVRAGLTPSQIVSLEKGRTNYTIESLLKYLFAVNRGLRDLTAMPYLQCVGRASWKPYKKAKTI